MPLDNEEPSKTAVVAPTPKRAPTPLRQAAPIDRDQKAVAEAAKRYQERTPAFEYQISSRDGGVMGLAPLHLDAAGHLLRELDVFGTSSVDFSRHSIGRIAAVMKDRREDIPSQINLNAGVAAVAGIAPRNETEAMLATQMVGTHEVAMEMLTRAKMATDPGQIERYGTLATKLLRTYTAQIEALAKVRRGGEQNVTVKHVHVYEGGQAIVGNVTTGKAGGHFDNGTQAHALTGTAALALSDGGSMLRQDQGRDAVPVAGGEWEGPVPDARRRPRQRRAKG